MKHGFFAPYVGQHVEVRSSEYSTKKPFDQSARTQGLLIGIAVREIGERSGILYDLVILQRNGTLRTINASRVVRIDALMATEVPPERPDTWDEIRARLGA